MALPPAIITATVNFGPYLDDAGAPFAGAVVFESARAKVWAATGTPILPRPITADLDANGMGSRVLPVTDQPGYTDGAGNAVTNWTYSVSIQLLGVAPERRNIALPTAGVSGIVVDLDMMTAVSSSTGILVAQPSVLSVNGQTGAVTVEAGGGTGDAQKANVPSTRVKNETTGVWPARATGYAYDIARGTDPGPLDTVDGDWRAIPR
jgi:hypothetical protein